MAYGSGEPLSAVLFTHTATHAATTVQDIYSTKPSQGLILLGGDSASRTDIARAFIADNWQVIPANTYDEVDANLHLGGIVACKVTGPHDMAAITRKMEQQGLWLPVIACVAGEDHALITAAIQSGAQAVLSWPFTPDDLNRVMTIAASGIARSAAQHNARSAARSRLASLTKRERDVLYAIIEHGSNKAVANVLNLSPRTVEIYRAKTMQRLGADHFARAVWFAYVADQRPGDDNS